MSGSIKLLKRNMHCEGRAIGIAVSTSGSNSADLILHSYMVNICGVLPEWSYRVRRNLYVNPIKSSKNQKAARSKTLCSCQCHVTRFWRRAGFRPVYLPGTQPSESRIGIQWAEARARRRQQPHAGTGQAFAFGSFGVSKDLITV